MNGPLSLSVGASSLAMDVNDDAFILDKRGVLKFFASKLAPTGGAVCFEISSRAGSSGCRPFLCKRLCKAAATCFLSP
ncbi:hypothetical protein EMIT0P218_50291 [Pseudomonas sp. IT-P218]